jgi:hypothetical protein
MMVAAMITFGLSLVAGIASSVAGRVRQGRARRAAMIALLEHAGRNHLLMKPPFVLALSAGMRFALSALLQLWGFKAVTHKCGGCAPVEFVGAIAFAAGLGLLLSGLRRLGDYALMRDAYDEARWLQQRRNRGASETR